MSTPIATIGRHRYGVGYTFAKRIEQVWATQGKRRRLVGFDAWLDGRQVVWGANSYVDAERALDELAYNLLADEAVIAADESAERDAEQDEPRYRVEMTGVLGDKWLDPQIYTDRARARAAVRYLMTDGNRFDTGKRARISSARVIEVDDEAVVTADEAAERDEASESAYMCEWCNTMHYDGLCELSHEAQAQLSELGAPFELTAEEAAVWNEAAGDFDAEIAAIYFIAKETPIRILIVGHSQTEAEAAEAAASLNANNTHPGDISYAVWSRKALFAALYEGDYIRFAMPGLNTEGLHPDEATALWREWYEDAVFARRGGAGCGDSNALRRMRWGR